MPWLSKILALPKDVGSKIAHPAFSVLTDKIVAFIDLETKYKYGKVSFQLREDSVTGEEYLIIEHRGPEGVIWVPLTRFDANNIADFLLKNFKY